MNIINALTLRHLKLNKKRTIVTIIGIILSVSMITAVPTFVSSFLSMMQKSVMDDTGNWHVLYKNIPTQKINLVMSDKNTATMALSKDIGYAELEGSKNVDKPYLFIKAYDEEAIESFNVDLVEGRFPAKTDELVISSHISENGGVEYQVGDVLKLDVGQRYIKEVNETYTLDQNSSFKVQSGDVRGERFIAESVKEYRITGIISRPKDEPYWSPGYTVISYLDKTELAPVDTVNISVAWKNINKKANEHANELAESIGSSGDRAVYNRDLLRFYGLMGDNILSTLYALGAVVIVLIIVGSVALIYNSFAISISERSRYLGMLASVGATRKQKSHSIFYEGFIVGIIGIPIGLFFGTLGMGITFMFVQPLIEGISNNVAKLILVTSPATIMITVLVSMITILISAYIPAKRAARISPVDAIRQSQDIKLTNRMVKTSKLTRSIFGFEAELGLKNLKRNSRRYKATVFSLVISIVLFLSVSSLSLLSKKSTEIIISDIPYDIRLSVTSSATIGEKKDFYTAISKLKYADESIIEQTMHGILTLESGLISDELREIIQPDYREQNIKTQDIYLQIKSMDEVALKKYAEEIGTDFNRLKDTLNASGILLNTVTIQTPDNKYMRMKHFNIGVGEKLKYYLTNGDSGKYNTELEVAVLTDKIPISEAMPANPFQAILIVSEDVYASIQSKLPKGYDNTYVDMVIKSSNSDSLVESIKEYQSQTSIASVNIYDVQKQSKQTDRLYTFVYVFFYGFVALITAICVANIFNTISTSISLRKREFAMLESIGMTPEGFNKMINYESLFYGIKALLYGLPISFGVMFLIYKSLRNTFGVGFAIPWGSVLIAVVAVFAIVSLTMLYASSKIKKENIIDALKDENI